MSTLLKKKRPIKAKSADYHDRIIVQPMARLAALLKSKGNGKKPISR